MGQGRLINLGGRRELARTVLGSLPTYVLTAIKPPKQWIRSKGGFFGLVANSCTEASVSSIGCGYVALLTMHGGLGITDLGCFGRALCLRWLWFQWKNPDKAWCGTELPIDDVDTALFAVATRVHVHNGRTAMFWTSSWLDDLSLASMFPALFQHNNKKRTMAEALPNGNWIRDIMQDITAPMFSDYVLLWGLVNEANFDSSAQEEDGFFFGALSTHLSRHMRCSLKEAFSPPFQAMCGHPPSANFSCGCCCKIESGQPIACSGGNGQTTTSAGFAIAIWKWYITCLWSARDKFGVRSVSGRRSQSSIPCSGLVIKVLPGGSMS
jgi:hypothetical protein